MGKALIIVESPAKIKTLKKFLGQNYVFESSLGHVRDLPEKEFGIDIEHDFEPKYVVMPEKQQVMTRLKKALKECDMVYLSPDPDREGEAIAWHISQLLPPKTPIKRVSFNSITKDAVLKALEEPREIDISLVNAQQARRLLDRIVGYKISPILNRRIQRGRDGFVSAGRVQSVALKLVVDREKEIMAFIPVEYWNLGAMFQTSPEEKPFRAMLFSVDGKKVEKEATDKPCTLINNEEIATSLLKRMENEPYHIQHVEKKEKKRNPQAPFITSTLQQEASRHFGYSSARTMNIAQSLYEGLDLGKEGAEGLITYMRTDSVRLAPEAIQEARDFIAKNFGKEYLPSQAKIFATKKSAQDAHEAIRPTNLQHPPEKLKSYLSKEQFSLYQLIWRRFIASQMLPAVYDTVSCDIVNDDHLLLRATGSILKFPGYLALYEEKQDDEDKDEESRQLPPLQEGQSLKLLDLTKEQSFTRPPPRYTEASLVKELEKSGIGRPSTYATIMNKIQSRDYTVKETGRLKPTELGQVIAGLLENSFQQIMNIGFTAQMEDNLELVAESKKNWKELIKDFWEQFFPTLAIAEKEGFVPKVLTDIDCPSCGAKLQKVWFKSKYFYGCSKYPDCTFSAPVEQISFNKDEYADDFNWDQPCPKCQSEMKVRHGRFGAFLGCSHYPTCKGIVNIPKKGEAQATQDENLPACPAIGCPGKMVAKKSRFGKIFYSCSTFPECNVIVNELDQLSVKYVDHPRTPYEKKAGAKKGRGGGFSLSKELTDCIGDTARSRGEVTKQIWIYIKEKGLQDPKNKRNIIPDDVLSKVLGTKEPVDMFKMTGLVAKHIR